MSDAIEQEIRILRALFWSERDPDGRAFVPLADAYLRAGEIDEALALLREGLDRHPGFASAHLVAARAHRARGDGEGVKRSLARVLEMDPGNASALRMRGELAESAGDPEGALSAFREAFRRNPAWEDLEGRIERLAAGFQASPATDDRPQAAGVQDAFSEDAGWPPQGPDGFAEPDALVAAGDDALDLGGDFALEEAFGSMDEADAAQSEASTPDAGPLELGTVELDAVELEPADRDRTGELEAHEALGEGHGEPGTPSLPSDDDLIDPFGFETDPAPAMAASASGSGSDPDPDPGDGDALVTRTLGELYARQGLILKAVEVFETLARRHPGDEGIAARLDELRQDAVGIRSGASEPAEAEPGEVGDAEETDPPAFVSEDPAALDASPIEEEPYQEEVQMEVEESGWDALGPEPEPELEPGAGDEAMDGGIAELEDAAAPRDVAAIVAERPVGAWFEDLLAWAPGAVPIERLAPSDLPIEDFEAPAIASVPGSSEAEAAVPPGPVDPPEADIPEDPEPAWADTSTPDALVAEAPASGAPAGGGEVAGAPDPVEDPDREAAGSRSSAPEGFEGLDDFQDWLRSLSR